MDPIYFILQLKLALPIILASNLALIFLIKPYWRFLLPIALWTLLVISFFALAAANAGAIGQIEQAYNESARGRSYGDKYLWDKLNDRLHQSTETQINLFRIIGAQTFLTLALQIAGYFKTGRRNLFWWTRTVFIFLAVAWLLLAGLSALAPTQPVMPG